MEKKYVISGYIKIISFSSGRKCSNPIYMLTKSKLEQNVRLEEISISFEFILLLVLNSEFR